MEQAKNKIIIEGKKVHNVGYRLFLMDLADDFLLPYFSAKNKIKDGKQQVVLFVGGKKEKIEKFIFEVKNQFPSNAKVDNISIFEYDDEIRTIESFSRSFSTSQLSKIVDAARHHLNM